MSQERLKLLKNLEHKWEFKHQLELKHSIILIFKVWIQCQQWLHLSNGKPDKKNYRKYKIKTVKGPDDYKSMREVVDDDTLAF